MLYKQCQLDFPSYAEWCKPEKMGARRVYIKKLISDYDMIILAKLAELMPENEDGYSLALLGWMFCVQGPMQRKETIKGYKEIIDELNNPEETNLCLKK
jgi:hypothetical protein